MLYVDGVDVTNDARIAPLRAGTTPLVIGHVVAGPFGRWIGDIDDLRIYDDALAPSAVLGLVIPTLPSTAN